MTTTPASAWLRGIFLPVLMIVTGSASLRHEAARRTTPAGEETCTLLAEHESLEKEYELASGTSFYLVVDPESAEMTLKHRGVPLQRYPIAAIQVGVPRIAFVRTPVQFRWIGTIWSHGLLEPQRLSDRFVLEVSDALPASAPAPPPLPPDNKGLVPVTYVLRYEPGLVVEIQRVRPDSDNRWQTWLSRWADRGREALAALSPAARRVMRVRILLSSDDADSLYRSLPPETNLLFVSRRRSGRGPLCESGSKRL